MNEPLTPSTTTEPGQSPASGSDHWPPLVGDSERSDPNEKTPPAAAITPRPAPKAAPLPSTPAAGEGEGDEAELEPEGVTVQTHQRGQPGKPLSKTQIRINQAVKAQREAERARDEAVAQAAAYRAQMDLRAGPAPSAQGQPALQAAAQAQPRDPHRPEPNVSEFSTYEDYVRAIAVWNSDRMAWALLQTQQQQQQEQQQAAATHAFEARREAWAAQHPDYHDVVAASDVPVSGVMDQVFTHHPAGVQIIDYLARHPEQGEQLAHLPDEVQLFELGRIAQIVGAQNGSGVVSNGRTPHVPRAPAPITPIGAGTHRSSDPGDLEFGPEYMRQGNEADRQRRRAGLR